MNCRFCGTPLKHEFIDLVNAPPSNSFLTREQLNEPEVFFPLRLFVCEKCFLVQIDEYKKSSDIFNTEYAYFSSYSSTWLDHAKKYVEMITERLRLNDAAHVIEIASNDGYLLQYFLQKQIPCLGIEPSANTAQVAKEKGIDTLEEFFSADLAEKLSQKGKKADLIIGNNVLAHVPDINDFVKGLKIALKSGGVITMEFPHLKKLVENNQFDTIYHEHFSYLSLATTKRILETNSLDICDVEELPTHGGSLRIYVKHTEDMSRTISFRTLKLLERERSKGMGRIDFYLDFQKRANHAKYKLLDFLIQQKRLGKQVIAYGAAAKGNTLINFCGIKSDLIAYAVDASPHKQGKFLPGSHIPVVSEASIKASKPDYILVLPWNIKEEIIEQLQYVRGWGGQFVIPIPDLTLV